jgi:hypothetical protein
MKYGIFCTKTNEIILAAETIEEAQNLMSRLTTKEGRKFFGTDEKEKEIWVITPYFEPVEKVIF